MTRQEQIIGHRQCMASAERCRETKMKAAAIVWLKMAEYWRKNLYIDYQYRQAAQDAIADHRTEAQAQRMGMWE